MRVGTLSRTALFSIATGLSLLHLSHRCCILPFMFHILGIREVFCGLKHGYLIVKLLCKVIRLTILTLFSD